MHNSRIQPHPGTQVASAGKVASHRPLASPGLLLSVLGFNDGVDAFVQVWDATATTDPDAALLFAFPVAAAKIFTLDTPVAVQRGIVLRSATALTHTAAQLNAGTGLGAADLLLLTRHV